MKKLFFALAFATTLAFCGAGFFVPQNHGKQNTVAGMLVLSDADMAVRNGGYGQWRSRRALGEAGKSKGNFANCSQSPCPVGRESRTFAKYVCEPCEGTESLWNSTMTTRVEESYCRKYIIPEECVYKYDITEWHESCVSFTGYNCGDHVW